MFSAPSVASYYRLRPQGWSASWTWLADRDREATLRVCPTTTIDGRDPARQHNIEYRAADATANPYVAIAALIRAGLGGLADRLPPPPVVVDHPDTLDSAACAALNLRRLPETLDDAIAAWQADLAAHGWFPPDFAETWLGVRRAELARLAGLSPDEACRLYRDLY